jgi:hypothetical protein
MRIKITEAVIRLTVKPSAFSTDIDAGFITMNQIGRRKLTFNPDFKILKSVKSILVEVVKRMIVSQVQRY